MAQRPHQQRKDGQPQGEAPPTAWEWLAAGIGLVLLLASIGYLLVDHARGDAAPPAPQVQVTGVEAQPGRFLVRVRVTNQSRGTAVGLRVEGELKRGEEVLERSDLEFDYVPGRSSREGGLFFTRDPRQLQLEVQARSYRAP